MSFKCDTSLFSSVRQQQVPHVWQSRRLSSRGIECFVRTVITISVVHLFVNWYCLWNGESQLSTTPKAFKTFHSSLDKIVFGSSVVDRDNRIDTHCCLCCHSRSSPSTPSLWGPCANLLLLLCQCTVAARTLPTVVEALRTVARHYSTTYRQWVRRRNALLLSFRNGNGKTAIKGSLLPVSWFDIHLIFRWVIYV